MQPIEPPNPPAKPPWLAGDNPLQLNNQNEIYNFLSKMLENLLEELKEYYATLLCKIPNAKKDGSDKDSAGSSNQVPDISREVRFKILNDLMSLLPDSINTHCENILEDMRYTFIRIYLSQFNPPVTDEIIINLLINRVNFILKGELCNFLAPKFANVILSYPSMLQSLRGNEFIQPAQLDDSEINPQHCIVTPENSMIVCSALPQAWNPLKYAGFSKLDTCFGFQIRHITSGLTVYVHLSRDLVIRRSVNKILKQFEGVLANDVTKQFEIRIAGGARRKIPDPLNPDDSTQMFNYFIIRLLAIAQRRGCHMRILSVDCFEKLYAIRESNQRTNFGDITVGCLFDIRTGIPVLIKHPQLQLQPFTGVGNALIVDESGKRYYVWVRIIKALGFFEKDPALFYNDDDKNFNHDFALKCKKDFRAAFIHRIIGILNNHTNLIADENDPFLQKLIDERLDSWEERFRLMYKLIKQDDPISHHFIQYLKIMANKDSIKKLVDKNILLLPPICRDLDIDKTFYGVLCRDLGLKLLIHEHAYEWFANVLCKININYLNYHAQIVMFLNRLSFSPWHLCSEIKEYQSHQLNPENVLSPNNLLARLRSTEKKDIDSIMTKWHEELYNREVLQKINAKLANVSIHKVELLQTINIHLIALSYRFMPLAHPLTQIKSSIDELVIRLADYIKLHQKTDTLQSMNYPIRKIIENWIIENRSTPLVSLIVLPSATQQVHELNQSSTSEERRDNYDKGCNMS